MIKNLNFIILGFLIGFATHKVVPPSFFQFWYSTPTKTPIKVKAERVNINIVHDYIFWNAKNLCKSHGSDLHYIVAKTHLFDVNDKYFPCKETIKIRCQNADIIDFDTGVGFCFISQDQLEETLK